MNKYKLTDETKEFDGVTLHRIKYLRDVGIFIKAGDLGGWIEKEENLSQHDNARVSGDALVSGDAEIYSDVDWMIAGPIGSRGGFTTIFRTKSGQSVNCGCFR